MKGDARHSFYRLSDCHAEHHTPVWSTRVKEWWERVYFMLSSLVCRSRRKTQTPTWVLKNDAYSYLINYTSICNRREDLSLGKRHRERAGRGPGEEGGAGRGEGGRSSKPKWLCSCRSPNLPLCTAQGEMRHSPGRAPVMWRGIREMNVFRVSNNHRIISTPSAFKSMDPSRLERHFDWESKSSLPLDTKDNEVAAFPLLSLYSHNLCKRWLSAGGCLSKSVINRADRNQFTAFSLSCVCVFEIALIYKIMSKSIIYVNTLIIARSVRFYCG